MKIINYPWSSVSMAQERQANCRKLSLDFPFEFRFHIEGKHLGVEVFELRHIFEH